MAAISPSELHPRAGSLPSWGRLLFLALWLALLAPAAPAHPMPKSFVEVRVLPDRWQLHLILPADRLEAAFMQAQLVPDPGPGSDARPQLQAAAVRDYVNARIGLRSVAGPAWEQHVTAVQAPQGQLDEWRVTLEALPPAGATPDQVVLRDEVLIREIATHDAVISLLQDWRGGVLPSQPQLLGSLGGEHHELLIERRAAQPWRAWLSMVLLGARHILEGLDHLAFLVTLILTVPLQAVAGRWQARAQLRPAVLATLWWVSAFTLGHSLSLLAASLGWLPPSGQAVEVLIAVSVGVSAAHALRPLYPRREAFVAGGFGLIHGLAFSTAIRELSLSAGQVVAATLSFNLGIELVQLGLVLVLVPFFIYTRHWVWSGWLRRAIALAALSTAAYWAVTRAMML